MSCLCHVYALITIYMLTRNMASCYPLKKRDCIKRLKVSVYMKRSKSAPDYYESVHGY